MRDALYQTGKLFSAINIPNWGGFKSLHLLIFKDTRLTITHIVLPIWLPYAEGCSFPHTLPACCLPSQHRSSNIIELFMNQESSRQVLFLWTCYFYGYTVLLSQQLSWSLIYRQNLNDTTRPNFLP